jgi:hypothetical protein
LKRSEIENSEIGHLVKNSAIVSALTYLAIALASPAFAQPPNAKTMRLYTNGPLTLVDYSSKPADAPVGFGAMTDTELRYHADYEFTAFPGGVNCQVKKLQCYAVLAHKTTWADPNRIKELLDHEQGHFDITQKHALLAQKALSPKVAKRQLKATAATAELARDLLAKALDAEIRHYSERGIAENKAYDESTRHGTLTDAQAEWRTRQLEELAALSKGKVKKATTKKAADPQASDEGSGKEPTSKKPTTKETAAPKSKP